MKKSRRWAALLAALMFAANLVAMPCEGTAWTPYLDPLPPTVDSGDPDGPSNTTAPVQSSVTITKTFGHWGITVTLLRGHVVFLVYPAARTEVLNLSSTGLHAGASRR